MGSMSHLPMVAELVEEALKGWSNSSSGESAEVCAANNAFTLLPMLWLIETDIVISGCMKGCPQLQQSDKLSGAGARSCCGRQAPCVWHCKS